MLRYSILFERSKLQHVTRPWTCFALHHLHMNHHTPHTSSVAALEAPIKHHLVTCLSALPNVTIYGDPSLDKRVGVLQHLAPNYVTRAFTFSTWELNHAESHQHHGGLPFFNCCRSFDDIVIGTVAFRIAGISPADAASALGDRGVFVGA